MTMWPMSIFAAAIAPPQAGPRAAGALRVLSSARASASGAPTCARAPSRRAFATMSDGGSEQYPAAGLAWDIETTGIDTNVAEIVQLAVVCANSARNASFSALVMPEGEVDPGAAAVHGLTKDRLRELGAKPLGDVWADCLDWIGASFPPTSPLVWAAHNGDRFDRPVLTRCLADAALPPPRAAAWLDTLTLARSALPGRYGKGSYTLTRLHADSCGAGIEGAHDALADAQALSTVRAHTRPHTPTHAEGTRMHTPTTRPEARRACVCDAGVAMAGRGSSGRRATTRDVPSAPPICCIPTPRATAAASRRVEARTPRHALVGVGSAVGRGAVGRRLRGRCGAHGDWGRAGGDAGCWPAHRVAAARKGNRRHRRVGGCRCDRVMAIYCDCAPIRVPPRRVPTCT